MPPRSPGRTGASGLTTEQLDQLITNLALSNERLNMATATLAESHSSFMRSAADADPNIGLSKSIPYTDSELSIVKKIDSTVDNDNRNGLAESARDTRPLLPDDYVSDRTDPKYDSTFPTHLYGAGHMPYSIEQRDTLAAYHRDRGRNTRKLEQQLPADGYMNTFSKPAEQHSQWQAHPLTMAGPLNEGDVRKGEVTISKFLDQNRWSHEYGKAYNAKQFMLNLSTTHADDL